MVVKHTRKKLKHQAIQEDLVQIDIYLLPAPMAEMYRILREVVVEDITMLLSPCYTHIERKADDEAGEHLVAYDEQSVAHWTYYLSPSNISQAQKARDKEQLSKYLHDLGAKIEGV